MLGWALVFPVLVVVAGALGVGGIAPISAAAAPMLFVVFLGLPAVTGVLHRVRAVGR